MERIGPGSGKNATLDESTLFRCGCQLIVYPAPACHALRPLPAARPLRAGMGWGATAADASSLSEGRAALFAGPAVGGEKNRLRGMHRAPLR